MMVYSTLQKPPTPHLQALSFDSPGGHQCVHCRLGIAEMDQPGCSCYNAHGAKMFPKCGSKMFRNTEYIEYMFIQRFCHVITCHHVDCCDINASTEAAFMLLNLMSTSNLAALPGHGSLRSTWRGTGQKSGSRLSCGDVNSLRVPQKNGTAAANICKQLNC